MIELLQEYFIFENNPSFSLQFKKYEPANQTRTFGLFCDIFMNDI